MKIISSTYYFNAAPHTVFHTIDDLGVTGGHMTKSSTMMMGSKLHLEYLTNHHIGLNTKYHWTGKMMGIPMDFTVLVTKWISGKEKIWETIGESKLIIYSWYRMSLKLEPVANQTKAVLSIAYKRPNGFFNKLCYYSATHI